MAPRKPAPPASPAGLAAPPDAAVVLKRLSTAYPGATTELLFRSPFELLVATILSAQSTDARVNLVTPVLFARFPTPAALAAAPLGEVEPIIQATGFFRAKSKAIVSMATRLVERHAGQVPASMDALVELPGVGRKTANVVLGHALDVPGLPVDRHVMRVATRIGLTTAKTPELIERDLTAQVPPKHWTLLSDCLILHGRRICRPRPACEKCPVSDRCVFFRTQTTTPAPRRTTSTKAVPGGSPRSDARKPARLVTKRPLR